MVLRSIMLSLALCAIVVARVVCPCTSSQAAQATSIEATTEAHACCGKSENPKDQQPPKPCEKHGENCSHCGTQLAPSDKAVDASQFSVAPALVSVIVEPVTGLSITTIRPEPRLTDPSPPSLLSLHCVLVI